MDESEVARFGPPDRLLMNVNTPDDYARVEYLPSDSASEPPPA
jgi:hypothetical protein